MRLRESRNETENLKTRQKRHEHGPEWSVAEIITVSPSMLKVYETLNRVAETDANVLILGKTERAGEPTARELHRSRAGLGDFRQRDLGAISERCLKANCSPQRKGHSLTP